MSATFPYSSPTENPDSDPAETKDWLDSLESVLEQEGAERAHYILEALIERTRRHGHYLPYSTSTAYINTIAPSRQIKSPGNHEMEERIRSICRWNAMAMVVRANKNNDELGGHISSYASSSTLYEVGFNHFWKGPNHPDGADLIYFQGHSAPGIYARAFLEGRLSEEQLHNFRREVDGKGISSYPHPWLMPNFWQFPTVSMGLGPIQAIYQARFMKYLHNRDIANTKNRKVWAFMGDGEMDEPESKGAIGLASREKLDNLVFVVNCNLQRLDGPVRGNGKIIQELESDFRGAGWNVIKVIWGSYWDGLLSQDKNGLLKKLMHETVDGEYQNMKANDGKYVRDKFFGKYPELLQRISHMSDDDVWQLNRGGHDPHKIYAAYSEAVNHVGQPTVILAKTVKGYGLGKVAEGKNPTHNIKKLDADSIRDFRDRFHLPIDDKDLASVPFYRPKADDPIMQYLHQQREALGGYLPSRSPKIKPITTPAIDSLASFYKGTGSKEMSTTMAFVRILTQLLRDKEIGKLIVPIIPDEARTFGMEGLFRQLGIYSARGQLYEPVDKEQIMYYREDKAGQILEEGINEAGATCSWLSGATAYANHHVNMIPFYTFYSMFGLQRIGDLAWAAGDMQARGFLMGGTAGRTTLNGEGLQHQDGHSHVLASTIPNCKAYDPAFAYELAVIILDGMKNMMQEQKNIFYYITIMNENYVHPAMPNINGIEQMIVRGAYPLQQSKLKTKNRVQLLGSGSILRESIAAAELLEKDWKVAADVWSVTSFNELARDGVEVERHNLMNFKAKAKQSYISEQMEATEGPIIAATDYIRTNAEQIRAYLPKNRTYKVLGTDGFGRSDSRERLRRFFEISRHWIVFTALKALVDEEKLDAKVIPEVIKKYQIDANKPNPASV